MSHRLVSVLVVCASGAAFPSIASGHSALLSPVPRTPLTLKTGPCGGVPRTQTPFVAEAGSQLEVTWDEYIDHPGDFRLLFSSGGDRDFAVLLDHIADKKIPAGEPSALYSVMVTLPSEPCEAETLQLIQVMTENPSSPAYYYSCADVRLVGAARGAGVRPRRHELGRGGRPGGCGRHPVPALRGTASHLPRRRRWRDDHGKVDVADAVAVLGSLFLGAGPLPPPAAPDCGPDPTEDGLPACAATCP